MSMDPRDEFDPAEPTRDVSTNSRLRQWFCTSTQELADLRAACNPLQTFGRRRRLSERTDTPRSPDAVVPHPAPRPRAPRRPAAPVDRADGLRADQGPSAGLHAR